VTYPLAPVFVVGGASPIWGYADLACHMHRPVRCTQVLTVSIRSRQPGLAAQPNRAEAIRLCTERPFAAVLQSGRTLIRLAESQDVVMSLHKT